MAGIRDDIRQSASLRGGYTSDADLLAVVEKAFGSRAFAKALSSVMEDFMEDMLDGVQKEMRSTAKDSKLDEVRRNFKKSKSQGKKGRSGSFVGAFAPKAKHMKSKTHAPKREAGIPDAQGRNVRQYTHLEDFDVKDLKQELEDLEDYMKELVATRRGEDYILFPNLRKEIDRLAVLEGSMTKGLLRKGLSGMPGIGRPARFLYEFKDQRRQAKRNKVRLDALVQANQKRMTQLRDSIMDSETRRSQQMASEAMVEGTHLKVARDNQKLLKKILKQANPGDAEALSKIPIPQALENAAISSIPTLLRSLLSFLVSPQFLAIAGVAVAGVLATEGLRRLINKIADEREEDAKNRRDKKAKELEAANKNLPKAEIQKAAQVQVMAERANNGGDMKNGAVRDQLAPLKRKFVKAREFELAKQGGMDASAINKQVEKEWSEYSTNPNGIANSPVARILDKDLRREAKVKPEVTPRPAGATDPSDAFIQKGSGVNLDNLDPGVRSNLLAMAKEYYALTGKKLPVNSAHRTHAQQEAEYRKDPKKAAKPGTSMHEYGYAVDVNSDAAEVLNKAGLMKKYGFVRPVGKEAWHMEAAAVQNQKADIRAGATPGPEARVSVAQTVPEGEGTTRGSSTPVVDASYDAPAYETPGAAAARVAATAQIGDGMDSGGGSVKVSASSGGAQNLSTIPLLVDNLNLMLYNTGAVR